MKKPIKVDLKSVNGQTTACVAAISESGGVELVSYFGRSIDRWDFVKFLDILHKKLNGRKVCLFFDQLSVHRAHVVRDTMLKYDMHHIFNCAYSPEFNGIEMTFAQVKHWIKRMRLDAIINKKRT